MIMPLKIHHVAIITKYSVLSEALAGRVSSSGQVIYKQYSMKRSLTPECRLDGLQVDAVLIDVPSTEVTVKRC